MTCHSFHMKTTKGKISHAISLICKASQHFMKMLASRSEVERVFPTAGAGCGGQDRAGRSSFLLQRYTLKDSANYFLVTVIFFYFFIYFFERRACKKKELNKLGSLHPYSTGLGRFCGLNSISPCSYLTPRLYQ